MKFDFYICKEGKEANTIQAVSFEFRGKQQCSSDIRSFMRTEGDTSVHFRETSDTSYFQDLMDKTVKKIGDEEGFNAKVTIDIPIEKITIDHKPFMISGIYIPKELIPALKANS